MIPEPILDGTEPEDITLPELWKLGRMHDDDGQPMEWEPTCHRKGLQLWYQPTNQILGAHCITCGKVYLLLDLSLR